MFSHTNTKRKSFTLVEMLIVVVIIGILATALIPRLQSVQARARDTTRKTDLSTIRSALMIFYTDNARFPFHPNGACGEPNAPRAESKGTCAGKRLTSETSFYNIITVVPVDPTNQRDPSGGAWVTNSYVYNYLNENQYNPALSIKRYDLIAQLENKKDPDRCEAKSYGFYAASGTPWCAPWPANNGYSPYLYSDHQ